MKQKSHSFDSEHAHFPPTLVFRPQRPKKTIPGLEKFPEAVERGENVGVWGLEESDFPKAHCCEKQWNKERSFGEGEIQPLGKSAKSTCRGFSYPLVGVTSNTPTSNVPSFFCLLLTPTVLYQFWLASKTYYPE